MVGGVLAQRYQLIGRDIARVQMDAGQALLGLSADDALGQWAAGCDVLLAECSLPEEMAVPTHLTPQRVGALAASARAGRLVLTHFYPPVERADIRALVSAHYAGPVTLAVDGSTFEIEED